MPEQYSRSDDQGSPGTQDTGQERGFDAPNATAEVSHRATERGLDMIQQSLRALTELNRPALEVVHDHGRRTAEAVAQFTGACHKAAESTADDIRALTASTMQLGCGLQEWQHAWAHVARRSMERTIQWQQAVLGCRSAADLAQVQHTFLCDTISAAVDAGAELLQVRVKTAQGAAEPLEQRARQHRRD